MNTPIFIKATDRYLIRFDHIQIIDVYDRHLKLTLRDGVSFEIDFKDEAELRAFRHAFFVEFGTANREIVK